MKKHVAIAVAFVIGMTCCISGAEQKEQQEITTVEKLKLKDGEYCVAGELKGGSGRASIESPLHIFVEDGNIMAEIIFSSPNYDYMIVDDTKYVPVNEEGNSTFLIPVPGLDYDMPVVADTVAMSEPHEIEYTIFLDSTTLEEVK